MEFSNKQEITMKTVDNLEKEIGLYAIADEPLDKCVHLTPNQSYKVLSYFEHESNKLFIVRDDSGALCSYNICHFTSIEMQTASKISNAPQKKKDVYLRVAFSMQELLSAVVEDKRIFYSEDGSKRYNYSMVTKDIQTSVMTEQGLYEWIRDCITFEDFNEGIYIKQ